MADARPQSLREALPGFRGLFHHLGPHLRGERRLLLLGCVGLLGGVLMSLLVPWPLALVVDGVVTARGSDIGVDLGGLGPTTLLLLAGVALLVISALRAAASHLTNRSFGLAGTRLLSTLRSDLVARLQRLTMASDDRVGHRDLATRITGDVARLRDVAVTAALPLLGSTLTLVSMVVLVAFVDWQLALVMMVVFLLHVRLTTMRAMSVHVLEPSSREAQGSNRTLRADVLVGVAASIVLVVGAQRVATGAMSPGGLVVLLSYLAMAFKPLRDIATYAGKIARATASAERIVDLFEETPTVTDRPGARPAPTFRGDVAMHDVWLECEPGHPVLRSVDLYVPSGQRIAVLGPSGAGKSSLANLLSRVCDPSHGRVTVDGYDLRDVTLATLRPQVAVVVQDSVLFPTTVRDNIALGAAASSDVDVAAAARLAGAHEFVMRLPHGYDTVVGERGCALSVGQRRRIAIARAAARRAPVVVLDEAMAGLDRDAEQGVSAALERLTAGCTTFVIGEDLHAALACDRAVWLCDGRVVDDGDPRRVLERQAGGLRDGS